MSTIPSIRVNNSQIKKYILNHVDQPERKLCV